MKTPVRLPFNLLGRCPASSIASQATSLFLSYQLQDVMQTLMNRPLVTSEASDDRLESPGSRDAYALAFSTDGLPADLRVGLFATPGSFTGHIRFANATSESDKEQDIRGMSIKLTGVPGVNLIAFYVGNGYLLGREYFELAAMRYRPPDEAKRMRKQNHGTVFVAGMFIAGFVSIPIVNLATPLFGTALMVHVHKRLSRGD